MMRADISQPDYDNILRVSHSKRIFYDANGSKVVEGNFVVMKDDMPSTIKC